MARARSAALSPQNISFCRYPSVKPDSWAATAMAMMGSNERTPGPWP